MPKDRMWGKRSAQNTAVSVVTKMEQSAPAASGKKITKKDFDIVWEWHRGKLSGQENRGYYVVRTKAGVNVKTGFRTKKLADEWLGKTIKVANKIRSGQIKVGKG